MSRAEPKKLFTVIQDDDGTLSIDWSAAMLPLLDDDGKTTDRILDLTEEILGVETDEDE